MREFQQLLEQAKGLTEINRAVTDLDRVTQSNSAASEELAASTSEIGGQLEQLNETVQSMEVMLGEDLAAQRESSTHSGDSPAVEYASVGSDNPLVVGRSGGTVRVESRKPVREHELHAP